MSYSPEYSISESKVRLPSEALSTVASELLSLPPSDLPIPHGSAVVVLGFLEHSIWTTRIYAKDSNISRVSMLAELVGLDLR